MARGHYLKPNTRQTMFTHHLFFDVETKLIKVDENRTEHRLKLGWALYWRKRGENEPDSLEWFPFTDTDAFWSWVEKHAYPKTTLYIFAHNIAYDFQVLLGFDKLSQRGWKLQNPYCKDATVIIRCVKGQKKIMLLDNMNIFRQPLEKLGEVAGLPKLKVDFETVTDEDLSEYCKRDVEIMFRARQYWYDFLAKHDLGNCAFTLPSQAFNAFRHRFMRHKLLVHQDEETIALEREAYHGGRTSAFFVGKGKNPPYCKLDINSAYPYVMKNYPYPIKHLFTTHTVSLDYLARQLKEKCVIARVEVECDEPVFPVVNRGHIVYPVGRFSAVLTTPELKYALSKGMIRSVEVAAFYQLGYPFVAYVDYFYALKRKAKEEKDKFAYHVTKLFLNSLYGKFGQKQRGMIPYAKVDKVMDKSMFIDDGKTGERFYVQRIGDTLWRSAPPGESNNSIPSIAAHVTAYTRMYLWELIQMAGRQHVLYCDTDSLITDAEGYRNLMPVCDDFDLGKLKLEGMSDEVEICVPKTYRFGETWVRKGIPKNAKEVSPNSFEFESFSSISGMGKLPLGSPYFSFRKIRSLRLVLFDGKVGADGWVIPFEASKLKLQPEFSPDVEEKLWEIELQIEALKEAKRLPQQLIFTLWDYRHGTWKRVRDSFGNVVPIEYSNYDSLATELGFDCLDDLLKAVEEQLQIDREIKTLRRRHRQIAHPTVGLAEFGDHSDPIPW